MKKKLFIIAILLLFAATGFAQDNVSLALYAGYTKSLIEEQPKSDGAPLLGFNVGYEVMKNLELGGGFNYVIGGFKFDREEDMLTYTTTWEYMVIGLYGKYFFDTGSLKPYTKAAVGYFMGDNIIEEGEDKLSLDWDGGIGYCFGVGILHNFGIFAEFNYNIVTRNDFGMNSWAVFIGYRFLR